MALVSIPADADDYCTSLCNLILPVPEGAGFLGAAWCIVLGIEVEKDLLSSEG